MVELSYKEQRKQAIRKLIRENWRNLSGYDWKLIKRFRTEFAENT